MVNKPGAIKFRRSQPSHREGDDDDLGISKLECPYAAEVDCDEKKPRSLPFSKRNWVAYMRTGPDAVVFWLGVTLATLVIFSGDTIQQINDYNYDNNKSYERRLTTIGPERIIFNTVHDQTASLWFHQHWKKLSISYGKPDYGNLIFESVVPVDQGRLFEKTREEFLESIDEKVDSSYSPGEDREDEDPRCRLPSWTDYTFPTCNQVHELLIERAFDQEVGQDFNVSYLNSGSYRDAWRFQRPGIDHLVLKRMMLAKKHTWGAKDLYTIHKEANILERLSRSPRILNIYGACGTSVFIEAMASDLHTKIIKGTGFAAQEELDKLDGVHPLNDFTPSEKLQISLDMAMSLADMHGFEGGPICHADTHIEQWLIAPDGSIKLNDFNNARQPTWDTRKGEYCLKHSSYGGVYRSPEEFMGWEQDESIDTFAYGNNIYTLLTGLWPFYDAEFKEISHKEMRKWVVAGKRPFVDQRYAKRSYIERKLIEIMERCWAQKRRERPPIFEVVKFLQEVKMNATKIGELQPSKMIMIPKTSAARGGLRM